MTKTINNHINKVQYCSYPGNSSQFAKKFMTFFLGFLLCAYYKKTNKTTYNFVGAGRCPTFPPAWRHRAGHLPSGQLVPTGTIYVDIAPVSQLIQVQQTSHPSLPNRSAGSHRYNKHRAAHLPSGQRAHAGTI